MSIFYFSFAYTGVARDYKKEARESVMEWESGHILSKERALLNSKAEFQNYSRY